MHPPPTNAADDFGQVRLTLLDASGIGEARVQYSAEMLGRGQLDRQVRGREQQVDGRASRDVL
jgi:hypothetical protein